jgi:hypothetical protein
MYFSILCVGAYMLLITGLMGAYVLCILIFAFSFGACRFICITYFLFSGVIMPLHCFIVFCVVHWNFWVGSVFSSVILMSFINVFTLLSKSFLCMITVVLPSSASAMMAFCCFNFSFYFVTYS